jgi:hypothetical protein
VNVDRRPEGRRYKGRKQERFEREFALRLGGTVLAFLMIEEEIRA